MSNTPHNSLPRIRRTGRLLCACLLLLVAASQALAGSASVIEVDAHLESVSLQPEVQILTDPGGDLDVAQVLRHQGFEPNRSAVDSLGFSAEVVWIRFELEQAIGGPDEVLLEIGYPLLDEVSLILFYPDGRLERLEAGDTFPFVGRVLRYANPTFSVNLSPDGPVTGLLRVRTSGYLKFPLRIWSRSAFTAQGSRAQFLYGIYYGIFLILTLVAGVMSIVTRDRTFLLYAGYLASYALLQLSLNGLISQQLWPFGGDLPSRLVPILTGTTMLLLVLFAGRFLGVWPQSRTLGGLFLGTLVLCVSIILLGLFGPLDLAIRVATATGISLLPIILVACIFSLRRGTWTASYFLLAWGLFLAGVSVTALSFVGLLPSVFLTTHAMQIGSLLEVWVLTLAMLEWVRQLRAQKEAAVASANKYLRQLNEELEDMVAKRTRELEFMACSDSLTGLLNHRASIEGVHALISQAARNRKPVAVVMLDVDHFKQVNDRFGHQRGDHILRLVADSLAMHSREGDICGRYGGEEFLLAVAGADQARAAGLAERLRLEITRISLDGVADWRLTASLGVAVFWPATAVTAEELIGRADSAMYRAKRKGRNRVELEGHDGLRGNVVSLER